MMRPMKDSGIEWIGKIPEGWGLERIGSIFDSRNEKVSDKDYAPLSVSKHGIVPQIETVAKTDDSDNRKLVLKNDFVINSRSDRKQSCGLSVLDGSVSLINIVMTIRDMRKILPSFLNYAMKNYGFAEEFYRWGHGIVADLWTTRWQEMKSIVLPIPPLAEQQAIADYLDEKCAAIDKLIDNQKAQIEKMKEYKQSVITEAVTKGLNPSVPMKDSGIYNIGIIPKGWNVERIKRFLEICNGKEVQSDDGEIPVYGSGGIFKYTDRAIYDGESILFGRKGTIDKPILVKGVFWTVDTMFYTKGIHDIIIKYLYYCCIGLIDYQFYKSGSVLPSMTQSELGNVIVTIPPLAEQQAIADYLDEKCAAIDKLIAVKQAKIDKLNDYKKSLIYEYVTGKREV